LSRVWCAGSYSPLSIPTAMPSSETNGWGAPRAIGTAVEIIEEEADSPLTLSSIAARCHVSFRSLRQGFRRHLINSPMAFLREVRLRRAHQTLLRSDPSAVTVASVLINGVSNLGRFATAHATRYGETPAETFRRTVFRPAAVAFIFARTERTSAQYGCPAKGPNHSLGAVDSYSLRVVTPGTARKAAGRSPRDTMAVVPLANQSSVCAKARLIAGMRNSARWIRAWASCAAVAALAWVW
jgi:AraC-like DNA-binding protein